MHPSELEPRSVIVIFSPHLGGVFLAVTAKKGDGMGVRRGRW